MRHNSETPARPTTYEGTISAPMTVGATRDNTTVVLGRRTEEALLRGLLTWPASEVVTVAHTLRASDFLNAFHRNIFEAVTRRAGDLVAQGEGKASVDPNAVLADLRDAGQLQHSTQGDALINVATGHPPALPEVRRLAGELVVRRLRNDMDVTGRVLIGASLQGTDDIVIALKSVVETLAQASRAGIEVSLP